MSKAARQRSARERLAEERKRRAKRDQRIRALLIGVSGVVVVALVVGIAIYFATKKEERTQVATAYNGPLAPVGRQANGSILMAQKGVTKPKLEIFEDFQCPICKRFENVSGDVVKKLAAQGKVSVTYVPFWLFSQYPDPIKSNSRRAANAALCAPENKWMSYHDALYKYQPKEGKAGFSDEDLIGWATDLGFGDAAFQKCVKDEQKGDEVDQMTKYAKQTKKVQGTPTVYLDGKKLDLKKVLLKPKVLQKTILAAGKPTESPSGAPSEQK